MKTIRLNLSSHDMDQLIDFLRVSVASPTACGYKNTHEDKHRLASLNELLHKLYPLHNGYKIKYTLNIALSHGLALLIHCKSTTLQLPIRDEILLNDIIGKVDQQTASNF